MVFLRAQLEALLAAILEAGDRANPKGREPGLGPATHSVEHYITRAREIRHRALVQLEHPEDTDGDSSDLPPER